MAYIREEEINKIRQEANIVDIISEYITLKPQGKNYVALCPFHNDVKHPSLVVSPDRQIFKCFSCPAGGNVFSFVMKIDNLSFPEAVEAVAHKIGYNLKVDHKNDNAPLKKEYAMYDLATKYYMNNLQTVSGKEALEYLNKRGITEEIIQEFKIGLSLNKTDELHQLLEQKKYSLDDMEKLGLVNKSGINVYDTFSNRIMIPIANMNGQIVAFTGRIYHNEDTAKYINTRETAIYKKGNILFNYHNAKKYIKEKQAVIVVEGNMDAIMMSSKGFKNVVALMGVAISSVAITELKKLHASIYLMLDNDKAGLEGTLDVGQKFLNAGLECQVVRLSGSKDPDEFLRAFGAEKLNEFLKTAPSYIDFKLNALAQNKDLHSIPNVVKYIKEVLASIDGADALTKETIIGSISEKYHIEKKVLESYLKNENEEKRKEPTVIYEKTPPIKRKNRYEKATNYVLYALMTDKKYMRIYKERLGYLKNKIERIIVSQIVYYSNSYNEINLADFTTFIQNDSDIYEKVMTIIQDIDGMEINMEEFNKCLDVIQTELKKDEIKTLKKEMQEEMDLDKKMALLQKLVEIKKEV